MNSKTLETTQQTKDVGRSLLPSQEILLLDNTSYFGYIGGVGSGKTTGGAIKSLKLCLEYPGIYGLITAPSYKTLQDATIPAYEEIFTSDFLNPINRTDMVGETKNGCKLFFRSTDYRWIEKALEGITCGFVHMDEASKSPVRAFRIAQARLRQKGMPRLLYITTTPDGFNWIYQEFVAKERPGYKYLIVRTGDNYLAPSDYYEKLVQAYANEDPRYTEQQLEGLFRIVGGDCPFNLKELNRLYQEAMTKEPIDVERNFIYRYTNRQIGKVYVIGADAATGQGQDESAFVIGTASPVSIDIIACGKRKMPESEFAEILDAQGRYYSNALVVVESAPVGKATLSKLEELRYPHIYQYKGKAGFPASRTTKPLLVNDLAEAVKDGTLHIPSAEIAEQLSSYMQDEKGQYHASEGARDDYVSALMMFIQGVKNVPMVSKLPAIKISGPATRNTY